MVSMEPSSKPLIFSGPGNMAEPLWKQGHPFQGADETVETAGGVFLVGRWKLGGKSGLRVAGNLGCGKFGCGNLVDMESLGCGFVQDLVARKLGIILLWVLNLSGLAVNSAGGFRDILEVSL